MRERILAIAKNATKDSVYKFESLAQTKEKALQKALNSYAKECPYEDIIAFMDATLFHSGKDGFILTEKTLYGHTCKSRPVPLESLVKVEPDKQYHLLLTFNDGSSYVQWFSIHVPEIMNLLQNLINLKLDPDEAGEIQNISDASDISNDSDHIPVSAQAPEAPSLVSTLADEWQIYEKEKLAFEKEKMTLKREKQIFDTLQQDFKQAKQIFENEQQIFHDEKQALEEEKQNFENKKTAFQEEKRKLENKKADFQEEKRKLENKKADFQEEKRKLKNEKTGFEEEKLDFLKERQAFEDKEQKLPTPDEEDDDDDEFLNPDLFDDFEEWREEKEAEKIAERKKVFAAAARCYKEGNYDYAFKLFKIAAEKGEPDAAMVLAKFYSEGIGVPADPEESFLWVKKAAELGNADAQYAVGVEYLQKENAEDNMEVIEYWFAKAADQGHETAQKGLPLIRRNRGVAYYNEGIKKIKQPHLDSNMNLILEDLTDALPDLEKAGELGIVEAQSKLASYYIYGNCSFNCRIFEDNYDEQERTDEEKGLYWLKKAVENEDAYATFTYAKYFFFGKLNCMEEISFVLGDYLKNYSFTKTKRTTRAFDYAVKASKLGCDDADTWIIQAAKYQIPGAQDAMNRINKDLSDL